VTGTPAFSPEPADHWVASRHRELLDGLGQYLDPDAGLRDIMLHADHADVIGTLGSHLDTQAGLAAILSPSADASPRSPHQTETAAAIAAVDPTVRMTLRRNPVILAAILSDLTVRALTIVDKAEAASERGLTLGLVRALARDLAVASNLARDLDPDFDLASAIVAARELARDLSRARASGFDRALVRALASNLADGLTRARARARGRISSSGLGLARDAARELDRDLDPPARDLNLAGTLDLARAHDRARALARDLAHQTALMVGDALGIRQTKELAAALLEGVLDDFTRANLAHADLTGRDLTGIRWSDWGTIWPPGTDTGALRAQSQEVGDGSGIFVITGPGSGDKARHHTRA
jgi:hypothetical protein